MTDKAQSKGGDAMICPKCQNYHPDGTEYCPVTGKRIETKQPNPAVHAVRELHDSVGNTSHVTFLGYREWYAVNGKVAIRVNGALVGHLGLNERLEIDLNQETVDVTVAWLFWGWEFRARTTLVRLSAKTVLQIRSSRWTGGVWIEKVGEI